MRGRTDHCTDHNASTQTHRHTQTHTQTHRHTQTHTQTHRHTRTRTHTDTDTHGHGHGHTHGHTHRGTQRNRGTNTHAGTHKQHAVTPSAGERATSASAGGTPSGRAHKPTHRDGVRDRREHPVDLTVRGSTVHRVPWNVVDDRIRRRRQHERLGLNSTAQHTTRNDITMLRVAKHCGSAAAPTPDTVATTPTLRSRAGKRTTHRAGAKCAAQ